MSESPSQMQMDEDRETAGAMGYLVTEFPDLSDVVRCLRENGFGDHADTVTMAIHYSVRHAMEERVFASERRERFLALNRRADAATYHLNEVAKWCEVHGHHIPKAMATKIRVVIADWSQRVYGVRNVEDMDIAGMLRGDVPIPELDSRDPVVKAAAELMHYLATVNTQERQSIIFSTPDDDDEGVALSGFCERLTAQLIYSLPGFDAADWEITAATARV